MLSIKKLLQGQPRRLRGTVAKNHMLKLKTANATEVAQTIRELYRQVMDVNPLPGQPGPRPPSSSGTQPEHRPARGRQRHAQAGGPDHRRGRPQQQPAGPVVRTRYGWTSRSSPRTSTRRRRTPTARCRSASPAAWTRRWCSRSLTPCRGAAPTTGRGLASGGGGNFRRRLRRRRRRRRRRRLRPAVRRRRGGGGGFGGGGMGGPGGGRGGGGGGGGGPRKGAAASGRTTPREGRIFSRTGSRMTLGRRTLYDPQLDTTAQSPITTTTDNRRGTPASPAGRHPEDAPLNLGTTPNSRLRGTAAPGRPRTGRRRRPAPSPCRASAPR